MINAETYYDDLYKLLQEKLRCKFNYIYLYPYGTIDKAKCRIYEQDKDNEKCKIFPTILMHDQEPIECNLKWYYKKDRFFNDFSHYNNNRYLVHCEKNSKVIENLETRLGICPIHFFGNSIIAQDWFRRYYYLDVSKKTPTKDFLIHQRLINGRASYRILFTDKILKNNLHKKSIISFGNNFNNQNVNKELQDPKSKIFKHKVCSKLLSYEPQIKKSFENSSHNIDRDEFADCFINVVCETNFWEERNYLTEKIFKPIVMKRPFILVSGAGTLEYLKGYGFKTFDKWWSEDYDYEEDPYTRLDKIIDIMIWWSKLSNHDKLVKLKQMELVLEHNRLNFFHTMPYNVVDEFINDLNKKFKVEFIPGHRIKKIFLEENPWPFLDEYRSAQLVRNSCKAYYEGIKYFNSSN